MEGTWNRSTINDKSIGTNLHLWRVCAHAKSTNKTSPAEPLPHPPYNVEKNTTATSSDSQYCIECGQGTVMGFWKENSAFLKLQ